MPNFEGNDYIEVRPSDDTVPYTFPFTVCSGVDANDGALPYGTTIANCVVTAVSMETSEDSTSELISDQNTGSTRVDVDLQYPGEDGVYRLVFVCTLNTGAVLEFWFDRVLAMS